MLILGLFDNNGPPDEVVEEVYCLTTKLVYTTPEEMNLLRWGFLLALNKFVRDFIKLKELRKVIIVDDENINDDENIFDLVRRAFQLEKEEYAEEQRHEVDIEVASNMINRGYSLKEIVDITQLDMDTLKQLKSAK